MAEISDQDRARRDARELSRWEPMRKAGETVMRETRRSQAAKAEEDGVSQVERRKPAVRGARV